MTLALEIITAFISTTIIIENIYSKIFLI